MIGHPNYPVEPWALREVRLDLSLLAQTESLFALSNGHLGLRGNLDEGEPHAISGTYLNGVYEAYPLPAAELAYGQPETAETVVNVTNGKLIRLLVDDEPLDVRYGTLTQHERVLDLRTGLLTRTVEWTSPAGRSVRIHSVRLVSLVHRSLAAVRYSVQPLDGDIRVVLQSELVANEPPPEPLGDPRSSAGLHAPLQPLVHEDFGRRAALLHLTTSSQLRLASAMDHEIDGPGNTQVITESHPNMARITAAADLGRDEALTLTKYFGYAWSSTRSAPSLRAQVDAAVAAGRHRGWQGLVDAQKQFLTRFWEGADVELEGDEELQQAVRFGMFHVLQAGVRAEQRALPAKGLTGPGYDGHAFWDTETYVLPMLTYTAPEAARDALRWRQNTVQLARARARQLNLKGAAYPWRTISGRECSGYWPASVAAFHINADIADAAVRYQQATGDEQFAEQTAVELLVETARMWASLGHRGASGKFHIDGVTGPDEYSALADDNIYTNLMARRNLAEAAKAARRFPAAASRLQVQEAEIEFWCLAAERMAVPVDAALGVHSQAQGFTHHDRWDFERTKDNQYPLFLNFAYFDLYRKQVIKQPDLVLALFLCGDAFTPAEKARNFSYYDALTVRDSSLAACINAVIAAEVGALDLAYDYFGEASLMDLEDLEHNVRDGLHLASLAGSWLAAVAGFGGMRDHSGRIEFSPRLPGPLRRLTFRVRTRGQVIKVTVEAERAVYELVSGEGLVVLHHGEEVQLAPRAPLERPIAPPPPLLHCEQPRHRAPEHRPGPADAGTGR